MQIFLIGYMGCGKTTVGRPLAKALGLRFIDMDHFIADKYHCTIPELFEAKGEEGFRQIERDTLHELASTENTVISTGGGSPCFFDNIDRMNRSGTTIYLKVSPEGLVKRLAHGRDKRPLLRGKSDEELLEFIRDSLAKRDRYYGQARIIVDCDGYSDIQIVEKCQRAVSFAEPHR